MVSTSSQKRTFPEKVPKSDKNPVFVRPVIANFCSTTMHFDGTSKITSEKAHLLRTSSKVAENSFW